MDDHPVMREGLAQLINQQDDLMVCGEAADASQTMPAIANMKPDVAVVDISLQGRSGLELIKDIRAQHPNLPTLVLSMHDETLYAERAIRAGARGYIMKKQPSENLLEGIRQVLRGQYYVSDRISTRILDLAAHRRNSEAASPVECLSDRELEIFQMIGEGRSTREIAEKLHLSIKTVASHRENLKHKLKLKRATELVRSAFHWAKENQAE